MRPIIPLAVSALSLAVVAMASAQDQPPDGAVVVHEQEDSYADPTSAGARLACGVVEQVS